MGIKTISSIKTIFTKGSCFKAHDGYCSSSGCINPMIVQFHELKRIVACVSKIFAVLPTGDETARFLHLILLHDVGVKVKGRILNEVYTVDIALEQCVMQQV